MASSTVIKNNMDGQVTLTDATADTPISLTVRFENGDFSLTGLKAKQRETVAYQSRGDLVSVRHTVKTFPTFSFTAMMSEFTSATANNLADAIRKKGAFASAVSTLGANADVFTLDAKFVVEGTDLGDSADHEINLEDCELSIDFAEGDPNTFTVNGTVYGDYDFGEGS